MKKENKSERVMVHVRMRPFSEEEIKHDNTSPIESFDTVSNTIGIKKDFDKKTYNYDTVLNMNIKQKDVFEKTAKEVVDSVIKGYNGTIFAYGQTGTGKTHTMVGNFEDENHKGIIPRTFTHIFDSIKNDKDYTYTISIAFIQIYLESIQDLVEPSNENIRIREDPENGVYLEGVEWITVKSPEDCRLVFLAGEKNRTVASTKMNAHSSRSHAIMIVKVEKGVLISPEKIKEIANISPDALKTERVMTKSMLFLVDLAGSERVKKTGADSVRLNEAKKINFSLLVLGNCIKSLSDGKGGHVSYRDSKLTRLLQESLGGNAKTSLIVTISPSSYNTDETISSLGFGQRAMKVQNKPQVNKSVDYQALCIKLQEDLDKLNDEYSKLKIENDKLVAENNKIKNGEMFVELQRKSICVMDQTNIDQISKAASPDAISKYKSPLQAEANSLLLNSPMNLSNNGDSIINFNAELKKLELFYEQLIRNKDAEYEKILIQVDNELSEKENENDELKNKNMEITNKYNILVDLLKDYESEKEDYQKSIIELTNKLEENKKASEKFISQLKKLQAIKPEDQTILSQLGNNLNSNNNIIGDILSKEFCDENKQNNSVSEINQNFNTFVCQNCTNKSLSNLNETHINEGVQIKESEKLGFIDSINFTNKFIEILRDNDFDLERFREKTQDKSYKIKILDLENLMVSIIEEKKELKIKATEIQTLLTTRDSKIKDLIEKDQKASNTIDGLRKEKLSLQNKINELNEISLLKENLSIEKLDKQESYYKLESQKKEEELNELKFGLSESLRKINELEDSNVELKRELEKKNDILFEFKNKSIDKNQLQIYYSELTKNAENFINEKHKILDKNIALFKEVEESIRRIKTEFKDLKNFSDKAENLKRNLNDSINSPEALNIDDPTINISRIFQNSMNYVNQMEKVIEDFEENFCKIEDEVISNFAMKKVSLLPKSSSSSKLNNYHGRNKSVFVNNQKNSIVCRVENLNTTSNSNNRANVSSDSNILMEENVSNFDSTNGANNKIKLPDENPDSVLNTIIRSNVDFEGFNGVFSNFIENIESINMEYMEIISGLIESEKFLLNALKQHRKIILQQNHDFSSLKLEIDLSRKNENFLKNSIIYLQQCSLENFSTIIPKEEIEEILYNLNNLSSTICDLDAPDVITLSSKILNEINIKINNFLNEKNLLIENFNEKINSLNKEIEMLKKIESTKQLQPQDKKEKVSSAQVQKLQAQLKFKEEEIARLNERIEEHLKTINKLSKEQILLKNTGSCEILSPEKKDSAGSGYEKLGLEVEKANQENIIVGNGIGPAKMTSGLNHNLTIGFIPGIANNNASNVSMGASPKIRRESSIIDFKNNKNSYEDEIRELRQQINEQKNTYETQIHKKEISYKELERIHDIESIKKTQKDANTGRYLIKDYLLRTQNFVDELFRYLNPSD